MRNSFIHQDSLKPSHKRWKQLQCSIECPRHLCSIVVFTHLTFFSFDLCFRLQFLTFNELSTVSNSKLLFRLVLLLPLPLTLIPFTKYSRNTSKYAGTAQRYGFVTSKLELTIDASVDYVFTFIGFLN